MMGGAGRVCVRYIVHYGLHYVYTMRMCDWLSRSIAYCGLHYACVCALLVI